VGDLRHLELKRVQGARSARLAGALLVVVAFVCTLAAPRPAAAQPFDLDTPADSPLWWTVTDAPSPAELRAALRDPEAHLERYPEALAGGSNEYVEIQREAVEARGGGRRAYAEVVGAARRGDFEVLRSVTSLSDDRLAELRTDWLRNPITEVAEPRLLELKAALDDWSWNLLRRYLLEVVVAGMGRESKDFDPGQGMIPRQGGSPPWPQGVGLPPLPVARFSPPEQVSAVDQAELTQMLPRVIKTEH